MPNRTITLVLEVEDSEQAKGIWNAHMNNTQVVGCKVRGIGNGNYFDKLRNYEKVIDEIAEEASSSSMRSCDKILRVIESLDQKDYLQE